MMERSFTLTCDWNLKFIHFLKVMNLFIRCDYKVVPEDRPMVEVPSRNLLVSVNIS